MLTLSISTLVTLIYSNHQHVFSTVSPVHSFIDRIDFSRLVCLRKYPRLLWYFLTNFPSYIRWHNTNLSITHSLFPLNCYHTIPDPFPASINVSTHQFQAANSPLPKNENIHIRIDSLNRCHGNIIVTAAITALCLTNSHKSFSLHKEDVVALHSYPIIRNCSVYGVTSGRWNSPFFCLADDISLSVATLQGSFSEHDIVPARHLLALAKGFIR